MQLKTDIKFVEHSLMSSPVHDLFMSGTLLPETYELLSMAQSRGGYIAGGFAVLVGYMCVVKKLLTSSNEFSGEVRRHLGSDMIILPGSPFRSAYHSDIDIWFPDQASLDAFKGAVDARSLTDMSVSNTVTGTAIEYVVRERQRVQVITKYLMPMREQLARFDIFNAMACIADNVLIVPEGWLELEESRTLHVATWKSPWAVSRIFKYMQKKGYTNLTPVTATYVIDEALAACAYVHAHPELAINDMSSNTFRRAFKRGTLPWYLKQLFASFTDEQLVLLSFICNDANSYSSSMHELIKRSSR